MTPFLLALETSSVAGSVALLRGPELVRQIELEEGLRHGRALLPAVEECLEAAGVKVTDLAAVAVSIGPGSYTGTRVGVMAAKALAFGARIPVVGISSLAALAWTARELAPTIIPVQDARRDEVYCAVYAVENGKQETAAAGMSAAAWPLAALRLDAALTPEEAARLGQGPDSALVGTAITRYRQLFRECAAPGTLVLEKPAAPTAAAVGFLAQARFAAGEVDEPLALQPVYLRRAGDPGPLGKTS